MSSTLFCRPTTGLTIFASFLLVISSAGRTWAGFQLPPKNVEAPRFELDKPTDLPLKETRHRVEVVGGIAHVRLTQVYVNKSSELLDATYVFPGSTRSAVSSLVMRIGERTVKADLRTKGEARKVFQKASDEGYRASLLEQKRPNVFSMALTNIRPGEQVEVELGYTELLEPEDGRYELVLPAVVAPRFGGKGEGLGDHPTIPATQAATWQADIHLRDGLGVTEVSSPTHGIQPRIAGKHSIGVKVSTRGDKEFVVRWRVVAGSQPDAGLVLYEGADENFLMMTVAPPKGLDEVRKPPREIVFVLDVSGSMRGFPLGVANTVMRESLGQLEKEDKFNILFFAGSGWALSPKPISATPKNINAAITAMSKQKGGGGTRLVNALESVAQLPRAQGLARTIVVVTDGLVSFEKKAFSKVREKLKGSTLFTLGIGGNVNRMLVEGLARAGGGTSYVAHDKKTAEFEAQRLVKAMRAPLLTDIEIKVEGLDVYDFEPPSFPDLYADRPVVVVAKYRGQAKGHVSFSAHASDRSLRRKLSFSQAKSSESNAPLRALWARRRLQRIADDRALVDGGADKETITQLGLRYHLLTEHTAFVAVDSEGGRSGGKKRKVVQPGAAPHGMQPNSGDFAFSQQKSFRRRSPSVIKSVGSALGRGGVSSGEGRLSTSPPASVRVKPRQLKNVPPAELSAVAAVEDQESSPGEQESRRAKPGLEILSLSISGELDHGKAKRVIFSQMPKLQKALHEAAKTPGFAVGRMSLELTIGDDGQVVSVRVLASDPGHESLVAALIKILNELKFGGGKGGLIQVLIRVH